MLLGGTIATAVGAFMKVDYLVLIGSPTLVLATMLESGLLFAHTMLVLLRHPTTFSVRKVMKF